MLVANRVFISKVAKADRNKTCSAFSFNYKPITQMKNFLKILFLADDAGAGGGGGNGSGATDDGSQGGGDDGSQTVSADEHKKVKAERDRFSGEIGDLRAKLDKLEKEKKEAEDAEAAKKGEHEKLANERLEEIQKLTKERDDFKAKADKFDTYTTERIKALTEKLPTDELKELAEGMELTKLEKFVEVHSKDEVPGTDKGKGGKGVQIVEGKKWDDYTSKELDEILKTSPAVYDKLYKEKYK